MKRLIGIFCLLAVLLGLTVVPTRAEAADGKYEVGYAIKDMNPWLDPANPDVNAMVDIKLTGNGNDDSRVCTGLMDDNGDGKIDTNDGLFITCLSVTDDWGKTVMYLTLDMLQGYPAAVNNVRSAIVEALGSDVISEDQIMLSGTHTHSGPNLYNISASSASDAWKTYYNYIITQATAAAVEAYNDRAPATMKRGSIDATASTAKRYNSGKGYKMNFIRHYDVTSTASFLGMTLGTKYHVAGSNFGGSVTAGGNSVFGKYNSLATYKVKTSTHAVEADNDMHLLTFEFAEKAPIVLVNWRAHPTTNSSSGGAYMTKASSDYVNSLRYYMGQAGYRTAFIQGAGGNAVIRSSVETDWKALWTDKTSSETNTYGRLLSEIALDCIENNMTDTGCRKDPDPSVYLPGRDPEGQRDPGGGCPGGFGLL